jgi:transposase
MSVFPSVHQAAAWAGVCPGNYESAGRHLGGRVRKGNVHLRTTLVEAAQPRPRPCVVSEEPHPIFVSRAPVTSSA